MKGGKNSFSLSHHLIVEINERGIRFFETDFPVGDPKGCLLFRLPKKLEGLKICQKLDLVVDCRTWIKLSVGYDFG